MEKQRWISRDTAQLLLDGYLAWAPFLLCILAGDLLNKDVLGLFVSVALTFLGWRLYAVGRGRRLVTFAFGFVAVILLNWIDILVRKLMS